MSNEINTQPVEFQGKKGLYAWEAIESVDPKLLPDKSDYGAVEPSDRVEHVDHRTYADNETDAVEWHYRTTDPEMDGPGRYAGSRLVIKEEGKPALEQGLEGFAQYAPIKDALRLRGRQVAKGIARRRFAERTLRELASS